jgi:antirestriction protein
MLATVTDAPMRAWVGCLACYNEGRLVGEWVDAVDAETFTPCQRVDHEEWWCMDHEGLPVSGECSPMEATRWAVWLSEVVEWQRGAVLAWVDLGGYSTDTDGLPILSDFDEAYCGEWDSFREYAENLAEECGYVPTCDDVEGNPLLAYVDWDAWTRDLAHDYGTASAPAGGVYVFRVM